MRATARLVSHATAAALAAMAYADALAREGTSLPPDFVRLSEVTREIRQEIRYAGSHNFVGRPIAGYSAAECWLRREAATALAAVAHDLVLEGWRLVVYDCYRPRRAVADFVRWAEDPGDQRRKAEFYPSLEKEKLFALGYIARQSAHSTGAAVDAGAERLSPAGDAAPIDFGTGFDTFDPRSATASPDIPDEAAANRRRLLRAFAAHGFANYAREWWHFSYRVATPTAYDIPITSAR